MGFPEEIWRCGWCDWWASTWVAREEEDVQECKTEEDAPYVASVPPPPAVHPKLEFDDSWGEAPGSACARFGEHRDDKDVEQRHQEMEDAAKAA